MTQRPLRVLIISNGGERRSTLEELFSQHNNDNHSNTTWEITWCTGITGRSLRGRQSCFEQINSVGLIPAEEWDIISQYSSSSDDLWNVMKERIPLLLSSSTTTTTTTTPNERSIHYSYEFWNKAKTINRGRSVLGCLLAHLKAMKQFVDGEYDVLLEDNVRWTKDALDRLAELCFQEDLVTKRGDLLYYGWLGSQPNLEWIFQHYITSTTTTTTTTTVDEPTMPFPTTQDIERTVGLSNDKEQPGGTPLWGMYAYWISKKGYEAIMDVLRRDIGSLFWKGKRMRYYSVKPADKVFPRSLQKHKLDVRIVTRPLFFRAPMLYSRIHPQWDARFCESTTIQLQRCNLDWNDLLLTQDEEDIVNHYKETGEWKRIVTGSPNVSGDE